MSNIKASETINLLEVKKYSSSKLLLALFYESVLWLLPVQYLFVCGTKDLTIRTKSIKLMNNTTI